jgi:predicted negative regulator of RcsB-dependent stress response
MAAKLSKQDLKGPDVFQSTFERITDYISENQTRFYVMVTATVVAVAIAFGIYLYWNNYQTSAVEIYAKAQENLTRSAQAQSPELAKESVKMYKELIDSYPRSWSAQVARYHLGNIYYQTGEIDNAIAAYKDFVASAPSDNSGIKFLALTSLGYCYEAKKDIKGALSYFEEAQKNSNPGFESIGFRNIARIYEQLSDKKKALENYQNALLKSTDPSMMIFIKRKISSLS